MIRSFTGPMFSDKSANLIDIYEDIWNKEIVGVFKPRLDRRDGAEIKSKRYPSISVPAIVIDSIEEIKQIVIDKNYKTVLIDEAQFLVGNVSDLVDLSVILDVDFYIAGLNMTSEQTPFGIMADILAVSDEIKHIHGCCQDCNRPSTYSYATIEKLDVVKVGNDYISLCPVCLKKRLMKQKGKEVVLRRMA